MLRLLTILLLSALTAQSATYYVSPTGSNTNSGSQAAPWLTIQYAANTVTNGDTVRVQPGYYLEKVAPVNDGITNNPITYLADGAVTNLGWEFSGDDYQRVIGFVVTHTNNALNYPGIFISSSDHIEILDCIISHIDGYCIRIVGDSSWLTIRGNTLEFPYGPVGGPLTGDAAISMANTPDRVLIEHNKINHVGDFLNGCGTNLVYRNNSLGPVVSTATDFPDFGSEHHIDAAQNNSALTYQLVENIFYTGNATNYNTDAHLHLNQIADSDGHIVRGNVVAQLGAGGLAWRISGNHRAYHNTWVDGNQSSAHTANTFHYAGWVDAPPASTGNIARNQIHDTVCNSMVYLLENSAAIDFGFDVNYNSGTQTNTSGLTNSNPLFVSRATGDFTLQSGSPARGLAGPLTLAAGDGTDSTTLIVDDASFFCDGWGMILGDEITIGSGSAVRISAIVTNTITLAEARSWSDNDEVRWQGRIDSGALPYGSAPLTAATNTAIGTTYTVTLVGDAGFVVFYRDGIPDTIVTEAPFTATITSGTVAAKVYAANAQAEPVILAVNAEAAPEPEPAPTGRYLNIRR